MEQWNEIPGFEGAYEASSLGRIRTMERVVRFGPKTRVLRSRLMTPRTSKVTGYAQVALSKDGRYKHFTVHALVLSAFNPAQSHSSECRHKDGCRTNNVLTNLEWGTRVQNMHDQYKHGTRIASEWHPLASFTVEVVQWIRESTQTAAEIARLLGVNTSTVCRARKGATYAAADRSQLVGLLA